MTLSSSLSTPVLFIIFNRPEIAFKAFEQIRKVKPCHLFIAADGPITNCPEDIKKCIDTRSLINLIDWDCKVETLFHDHNKGCGYGPAEAISWFFSNVEQGIILEEDCIADESFFFFCEVLLRKYEHDETITMIAGTNPFKEWNYGKESYFFSNMAFSWGWASWRRAWQTFDYKADKWFSQEGKDKVREHLRYSIFYNHFEKEFNYYFKNVRSDVWDMQWLFARLYKQSYSVIPLKNLVSNIGFNSDSTHTFDATINIAHLAIHPIRESLTHPRSKKINLFFDWYLFERFIYSKPRNFTRKALVKILKIIT